MTNRIILEVTVFTNIAEALRFIANNNRPEIAYLPDFRVFY